MAQTTLYIKFLILLLLSWIVYSVAFSTQFCLFLMMDSPSLFHCYLKKIKFQTFLLHKNKKFDKKYISHIMQELIHIQRFFSSVSVHRIEYLDSNFRSSTCNLDLQCGIIFFITSLCDKGWAIFESIIREFEETVNMTVIFM